MRLGAVLGPSWGHLGAILGPSWSHLGAILAPSWAILGDLSRDDGEIVEHRKSIKHLMKTLVFKPQRLPKSANVSPT